MAMVRRVDVLDGKTKSWMADAECLRQTAVSKVEHQHALQLIRSSTDLIYSYAVQVRHIKSLDWTSGSILEDTLTFE